MTVSKARKAKQESVNALQTYLTSLLYLRQEARRDGLEVVAEILWDALSAIEKWLDTGEAPASSGDLLDLPLCHSLDFLLKWLSLPPARQRLVTQHLARYEAGTGTGGVAPRPLPHANKKSVN